MDLHPARTQAAGRSCLRHLQNQLAMLAMSALVIVLPTLLSITPLSTSPTIGRILY